MLSLLKSLDPIPSQRQARKKWGGYGKRALLALAAATAIVCGGFVNVGATVHVDESTTSTVNEVYTKGEVDTSFATKTEVAAKADSTTVTAQGTKIEALETAVGKTYTKDEVDSKLTAASTSVDTKLADYAKTTDVNTALAGKANVGDSYTKAEADGKFATSDALTTAKTDLEGKITTAKTDLEGKINTAKTELDGKIAANTTKIDANKTSIDDLKTKAATTDTTLTDLSGRMTTAESNIIDLKNADVRLEGKIDQNTNDITGLKDKDTELSGMIDANKAAIDQNKDNITQNKNDITTINGKLTTAEGKIAANETAIADLNTKVGTVNNGTYLDSSKSVGENLNKLNDGLVQEVANRTAADTALSNRIGIVDADGTFIKKSDTNNVSENLKALDTATAANKAATETNATNIAKNTTDIAAEKAAREAADNTLQSNIDAEAAARENKDNELTNRIDATDKRTAGIGRTDTGVEADNQTVIEGKVHFDQEGNVSKVKNLGAETITTTGDATIGGDLNVTGDTSLKDTTVNGTLKTTGEATFEDNVTVKKNLTVDGNLNVNEISMSNTKTDSDGTIHNSATTITADSMTNNASIKKNGQTTESQFTHTEEGTFNYAHQGDSTDWKEATSNVTADGVENIAKDSEGNNNTFTQTSTDTKNTLTDKDGNTSTTRQDGKGIYGYAKDKDGNKSYTKQEGDRIAESVIGKEGKKTQSEMTSTDITNTAKDGTITNDAKDIVNKASGDMTNTVGGNLKNEVTGDIENSATNITNKTTGDMKNTIGGKLTTTVTGATEENYNGGLTTNVTGEEKHTVTGNQNNKVTGKQTNTVEGGQENNISGGQTNNILTGNQETTVSDGSIINKAENGDISNIAKNVTNEGTESVTNKVGTNEVKVSQDGVDIKADAGKTIKESVGTDTSRTMTDGNIIDQAGDKTVTTDENTGTTFGNGTPNDTTVINGGTIGTNKVNANETNTKKLTAGADADADGGRLTVDAADGVKGSYKSGDYTSKSYILKNTLKSGVDNGKDVADADYVGATTDHYVDADNKAHLDETVKDVAGSNVTNKTSTGTVTTITDGTNTSIIDQKKDSITSAVGDGATSTVIKQDKDNVTIASSAGTVGIAGKDIINAATDTITNTAGTKITDTAGDSNVTTENGKGTTFTKTGTTAVTDGGTTETNIQGNKLKTGALESETLSVGGKIGNNEAKLDVNPNGGITSSATDGTNTTVVNQTATGIASSAKDGNGNENGSLTNATMTANTITDGTQANSVISTKDGTDFINSGATAPVTGASGDGTATKTTIKGNTITTGKVTMDYADVMKDLGVRGNATIEGKTTTGELEVTGKSTLKGDVTMEGNATVKKDLTVEGTTQTKELNVTNNANIGGTLDVAGKSNFHEDVTMDKNLSVGGNVDAGSFTVKGTDIKIDQDGINAGGLPITNVGDGSVAPGSKDVVNGGQLYDVKTDLESKVNKVGANAAAMANLHPMEFDPDSKWNIAAAMGNYGSETATAMGLFYRPNEDVMVNLSTAFGTGENMVGGGVSVRLGQGGNKLTRKENNELKAQVNDLTARMDALLSVLNPNMSKDFPDVPENHWAYEAVSRLAGNDIVQGYPDGEFHGERTMTRYEMAEIIYKALSRGAEAERELVEEFKPELQAMAASNKASAEAPTTNE